MKLVKSKCEIDGCNVIDACALHLHHIIERTQVESTNNPWNYAILCSVHHNLCHDGQLKIIGPYPSTRLPNKRTLIYELNRNKKY